MCNVVKYLGHWCKCHGDIEFVFTDQAPSTVVDGQHGGTNAHVNPPCHHVAAIKTQSGVRATNAFTIVSDFAFFDKAGLNQRTYMSTYAGLKDPQGSTQHA